MKITFFKAYCLICWKEFDTPTLPDMSYGEAIYFDKSKNEYGYFSWFENVELQNVVQAVMKEKFSKANNAWILAGLLSDRKWKPLNSACPCPRCGFKLTYVANTRTRLGDIQLLTFRNFLSLTTEEQVAEIMESMENRM